jgi:hypothetical protein
MRSGFRRRKTAAKCVSKSCHMPRKSLVATGARSGACVRARHARRRRGMKIEGAAHVRRYACAVHVRATMSRSSRGSNRAIRPIATSASEATAARSPAARQVTRSQSGWRRIATELARVRGGRLTCFVSRGSQRRVPGLRMPTPLKARPEKHLRPNLPPVGPPYPPRQLLCSAPTLFPRLKVVVGRSCAETRRDAFRRTGPHAVGDGLVPLWRIKSFSEKDLRQRERARAGGGSPTPRLLGVTYSLANFRMKQLRK